MELDYGYVAAGRRRMSDAGVRCHAINPDTGRALCGFDGGPNGFECDTDEDTPSCRRCKRVLAKAGPTQDGPQP